MLKGGRERDPTGFIFPFRFSEASTTSVITIFVVVVVI